MTDSENEVKLEESGSHFGSAFFGRGGAPRFPGGFWRRLKRSPPFVVIELVGALAMPAWHGPLRGLSPLTPNSRGGF